MVYIADDAKQFRGPMSRKMLDELRKIQAEFETKVISGGGSATCTIAANDSPASQKAQADYICSGSHDEITINNQLFNAKNGIVLLMEGSYYISGGIIVPTNTVLNGMGIGTKIYRTDSISGETLSEYINDSITSFNVSDGSIFTIGQTIRIDFEDFYITNISLNILTVLPRSHNGSMAATHANGSIISFNMEMIRNELQMEGGTSNVHISNLWLDAGDGIVSNPISNGITIRNCNYSSVSMCWVQNTKGTHPTGPNMDSIRGIGIALDHSNFCDIYNNCVTATSHGCISIRNNCNNCNIYSNYIWNSDYEGIVVCNKTFGSSSSTGEGCSDIIINSNHVYDCGIVGGSCGIYIEDQATSGIGNPHMRIEIVNNIIKKITSGLMTGIIILRNDGTTYTDQYCIITNNIIENVDYVGIKIDRSPSNTISNNYTLNSTLSGISISNSNYSNVISNHSSLNISSGIGLNASSYCNISNNFIKDNNASQLYMYGICTDNMIVNNQIKSIDDTKGIDIASYGAVRNTIALNKITCIGNGNNGYGINIVNGVDYAHIINNTIGDLNDSGTSTKRGISIASEYCLISGNKITSVSPSHSFYYAIRLDATSMNNVIKNNDLYDGYNNAGIYDTGIDNIVQYNRGYITENSGTATIINGNTLIIVNHGLDVTPSAGDITITPIEMWGNMTQYYIDTFTPTQFTINTNIDPGQNVAFAWKAIVL